MAEYVLVYRTANDKGSGRVIYRSVITNAPSSEAVITMFQTIMNGPDSEIVSLEVASPSEMGVSIAYHDLSWMDGKQMASHSSVA